MVQRGGVLLFRFHFVKSFDTAMNPVVNRLIKSFDHGPPCRTIFPDNPDSRCMHNFSHHPSPFFDKMLQTLMENTTKKR
jgi:hypothetical protein